MAGFLLELELDSWLGPMPGLAPCPNESHDAQHGQAADREAESPCTSTPAPSPPCFDATKPIVFQVGNLGQHYWDWVNHPEPGRPRFFSSTFAEGCSKVKWWIVPLIWLPFFSSVLWYSQQLSDSSGWAAAAALVPAGIVAWQGLEYTIHRFVFHADVKSYWGLTLHFLFHGCHHKYPMDRDRLVFPPLPASWFIAATYAVLTAVLPQRYALPVFAGMGYGYVAYDCLHYMIHHTGSGFAGRLPIIRGLKSRHLHHHYKDHNAGFGISSSLFDLLLGTSVAERSSSSSSSSGVAAR